MPFAPLFLLDAATSGTVPFVAPGTEVHARRFATETRQEREDNRDAREHEPVREVELRGDACRGLWAGTFEWPWDYRHEARDRR